MGDQFLTTICIQGESYASLLWPVSSAVEQHPDKVLVASSILAQATSLCRVTTEGNGHYPFTVAYLYWGSNPPHDSNLWTAKAVYRMSKVR